MKRLLPLWAILAIAVFLLPAGTAAADNFMVNAGTTDSDAFYAVSTTADGGYATFGKAGSDAVAAKFNIHGRLEWTRAFEGVDTSNCNSGAAGEDGLFLSGRIDNSTLWMTKITPWGEVLWQKTYTYAGYSSPNLIGVSVAPTTDGGCAVKARINVDGSSGDYYYDLGLAKIDADGNLEWFKSYGTANYDNAGTVIATVDSEGNADGYLLATQEDGWGGTDLDNEVIPGQTRYRRRPAVGQGLCRLRHFGSGRGRRPRILQGGLPDRRFRFRGGGAELLGQRSGLEQPPHPLPSSR